MGNTSELQGSENHIILDENLAWEQAIKIDAGYEEAQELGIGDRASEVIMAHGRRRMVAEALAACPEFGQSIRIVTESMRDSGVDESVIKNAVNRTIDKKAEEAANAPIPDRILEQQTMEESSNKAVKKNN